MTIAELDRWALERSWGEARRARLDQFLRRFVVYPYTRDLARTWAEVTVASSKVGRPIACADAWIASTAIVEDVPLITNNGKDYEAVPGLVVVSESS